MSLMARNEQTALCVSGQTLRRLVIALISQAQADKQRQGLIREDQTLAPLCFGRSDADIDAIAIDEATLGFDSLSRLELINAINQFFQLSQTGAEDYLLLTPSIGRWIEVITHHMQLVGEDLRLGFSTSGSVGPVCVHVHPLSQLRAEITALCEGPLIALSVSSRVIALVPPHHIYGFLFTCLLPATLNVEVLDLHQKAPSALAREAQSGDLVIGTPFTWKMVAAAGLPLPTGLQGITSAAPSRSDTWERGETGRPDVMIEIYGSTETGGLGSRRAWGDPFELLSHLEPFEDGIARSAAPNVPLPVQDKLIWQSNRSFALQGRLDHVVQIAGVNVNPNLVANLLLELPQVAEASVRMGHDRLKAFVVPSSQATDISELRRAIDDHLRAHLPDAARPGTLQFGDALPRNAMGKMMDWNIQNNAAAPSLTRVAQKNATTVNLVN